MIFSSGYLLWVFVPTLVMTMFAQWRVKSAYNKWSKVPNQQGWTSDEAARRIIEFTGLHGVEIGRTPGQLTDHYDPRSKTIRLSDSTVERPSVAALAIVAHELGHAQQDQVGSTMLNVRSALVPAANIGSNLGMWVLLGGFIAQIEALQWAGVIMFGAAVAFTLVTLPVDFDASRRAKGILERMGASSGGDAKGVAQVLDAAALTYVAAAASSVLTLLYYVSLLTGRRN
jgi:uncharacterized protein